MPARVLAVLLALLPAASSIASSASAPAPAATARRLSAGFAKRILTPSLSAGEVYLAGFGHDRKATAVHDDLYARCLAVSDGGLKLALCSVDLIGLFLPDIDKTRALLLERVPGARLVVASTHNHEGPDTLGLWGPSPIQSGVDRAYLEGLRRDIVEAAAEALGALQPAAFTFATGRTPGLIADGREPKVVDDAIVIARAIGKGGQALGTLVNWSSHPEALGGKNTLLTADYPHYLVRRVEAALGGTCVFFSGSLVLGGIQEPQDAGADYLGAAREPALRDLLRAEHRMVFGLANDELGYVIPRAQWDEKPPFAYGREEAPYGEVNSVGDDVAPRLAEAFRLLLAHR